MQTLRLFLLSRVKKYVHFGREIKLIEFIKKLSHCKCIVDIGIPEKFEFCITLLKCMVQANNKKGGQSV
jgi:hypothetical protein